MKIIRSIFFTFLMCLFHNSISQSLEDKSIVFVSRGIQSRVKISVLKEELKNKKYRNKPRWGVYLDSIDNTSWKGDFIVDCYGKRWDLITLDNTLLKLFKKGRVDVKYKERFLDCNETDYKTQKAYCDDGTKYGKKFVIYKNDIEIGYYFKKYNKNCWW